MQKKIDELEKRIKSLESFQYLITFLVVFSVVVIVFGGIYKMEYGESTQEQQVVNKAVASKNHQAKISTDKNKKTAN